MADPKPSTPDSSFETDIFAYVNYRLFLKDLIHELKRKKLYKVKSFAKRAGIKTPGYMKMIIDGKRNLTVEMMQKFAHALGIKGKEKIYFERLVLYAHSADPDLKKEYFDELMVLKPRSSEYRLTKKTTQIFQPSLLCLCSGNGRVERFSR